MPEPLADLDDFAGCAEEACAALEPFRNEALARAPDPNRTHAVDLACGKGRAAIAFAERFGWRTLGIDAMTDFIDDAEREAHKRGLSRLCRFIHADLRDAPRLAEPATVGVMLGVGSALDGGLPAALDALRAAVEPGGLALFDDAFRTDTASETWSDLPTLDAARDAVRKHGTVVIESIAHAQDTRRVNEANTRLIIEHARNIRTGKPEERAALER